jgi:hypothetical protein
VTGIPTFEPTSEPTPEVTTQPTTQPTSEPTPIPTPEPTFEPTSVPTAIPTTEPTQGPTAVPTAEPGPSPTPGYSIGLKVYYRCAINAIDTNQIKPHLQIISESSENHPLSELTMKYYYTKDGTENEDFNVEWAVIGNDNVTGTFYDGYLEVGFTAGAGEIGVGGSTGDIQIEFNKVNWSNYDQSNDYSFDPSKNEVSSEWDHVTLYQNGSLIWGVEPDGMTPMPTDSPEPSAVPTSEPTAEPSAEPTTIPTAEPTSVPTETPHPTAEPTSAPTETPLPTAEPTPGNDLKVRYKCGDPAAPADGQIKPHIIIFNEGPIEVTMSELTLRYYYTKEGTTSEEFIIDFANIGGGNITGSFQDGYLEVGFTSGAGSIIGGSDSGEIMMRFNKTDWSNYDEGNDYSYGNIDAYQDWDRITLYHNGTRVWGIEP